jgi:hypothetical protein
LQPSPEDDARPPATLPKRVFCDAQLAGGAFAAFISSQENRASPSSIRAPAWVAGRRAVALTEREAPP